VLSRKVASFVEVYGPAIPVGQIPRVTVTFANPRVNGQPVAPRSIQAVYPKGVPDYAEARAADGKIVIDVGRPVRQRSSRNVRLVE